MQSKVKRTMIRIAAILAVFVLSNITAYAADSDPISSINSLSDIILTIVRAIGFISLLLGVVQIGLSFKSHDPSQRTQGMLVLAGGLLIFFVKELLNLIGANL